MTATKTRRLELRTDEATDQLISQAADLLYSDLRIMPMSTRKCFRGNAFALVKSA